MAQRRPPPRGKRAASKLSITRRSTFRLPNGPVVEPGSGDHDPTKMGSEDAGQTGWTVIPFLKHWVIVLQLTA